MRLGWEAAAATDVGRVRAGNEDTFLIDARRGVFLVADGMGGHAAGEVASALATTAVGEALRTGVDAGLQADALAAAMVASFRRANRAIQDFSAAHPETAGMGTTMTALALCDDGTFRVAHIGDSRMYVLRHGELHQVTRDHTWVQQEVDSGRLTAAGARRHHLGSVLTRALGADHDEPEVFVGTLLPDDLVLLATDGLTGMLSDRLLRRVLDRPATPAE
ncbi:MAG TPA: protein phosphatase 2C domain-containing protein, partial [Longimicrobiaceae bacterium]|nr:protein phosphatase 2C domain-containing protein [Longimicrobiaceae bacterium]